MTKKNPEYLSKYEIFIVHMHNICLYYECSLKYPAYQFCIIHMHHEEEEDEQLQHQKTFIMR